MSGRIDIILDFVLHEILYWNTRRKLKKNFPHFCVIPGDIIGDDIIIKGLYEEDLLIPLFNKIFKNFVPMFQKSIVLDVGANIGNHSIFFSRYFHRVIAFEPNKTAIQIFRVNISINHICNVDINEVGLGNESANKFFIGNYVNLGGSHFIDPEPINKKNQQELINNIEIFPVVTGDGILKITTSERIALIKLDCERYELFALQGLKKTICMYKPIILFEAHGSEGETGSKAIFTFLKENGYHFFYRYEPRLSSLKFSLVKLIFGSTPNLIRIETPDDRTYRLLIAAFEELQ